MTSLIDNDYIEFTKNIIGAYWPYIGGLVPVSGILGTAIYSFKRRPKSTSREADLTYFTETEFLKPPIERPAYSDRMAYVLSEMSALAYYQFEGKSGFIEDAVQHALERNLTERMDIHQFLEQFSTDLMSGQNLSLDTFRKILGNSGFSLIDVINIEETQGFVCKRDVPNEAPYLILAFRGTEKKVSDWLTDARCLPTVEGKTKVHTGFLDAFSKNTDSEGKTVKTKVMEILEQPEVKDDKGTLLPLFITGHSLGGALALLATKLIAPNITGACYTFGAPRIGNYEFFRLIKTPVYRIVNSADVVPRVPPGAVMLIFSNALKALSWLTILVRPVSSLFDWIEEKIDKLKGYRHHGDLRYLTDVAEGRFDTARLLTNPPIIDRIMWAWRHLGNSIFVPVQCHSISIYRKKLASIATQRNRRVNKG